MKVLQMVSFWMGLLVLYSCSQSTVPKQSVTLKMIGSMPNITLENDYAYYGFEANEEYLVWFEGYTSTLYIYNLLEERLSNMAIKEGRGPHELGQLSGLTISDSNIIYLSDHINAKLIRVAVSGKFLSDLSPSSNIKPSKLTSSNDFNIMMTVLNDNALFYLFEEKQLIPIEQSANLFPTGTAGLFQKEGYLTIRNARFVLLTKYYPRLYLYDLNQKKFIKKITFDESEVEGDESIEREDGSKAFLPPSKVDILSEDVAFVPGSDNRVFMLAKGASDNRTYGLDKLFGYDLEDEVFTATHDLGLKAAEITVNDKYLFVYSEEKNKMYKYEILQPQ